MSDRVREGPATAGTRDAGGSNAGFAGRVRIKIAYLMRAEYHFKQ